MAIAKLIGEKMDKLERELQLALTRKVAEDFKDPMGPLSALSEAALAPIGRCGFISKRCGFYNGSNIGTANREENYTQKVTDFQAHSKKMAETATALAKSGVVTDRQLAEDLIKTAKKVESIL